MLIKVVIIFVFVISVFAQAGHIDSECRRGKLPFVAAVDVKRVRDKFRVCLLKRLLNGTIYEMMRVETLFISKLSGTTDTGYYESTIYGFQFGFMGGTVGYGTDGFGYKNDAIIEIEISGNQFFCKERSQHHAT